MQPTASRVIPNRRSVTSSTLTPFSCASFNVRLLSAVGRAASGVAAWADAASAVFAIENIEPCPFGENTAKYTPASPATATTAITAASRKTSLLSKDLPPNAMNAPLSVRLANQKRLACASSSSPARARRANDYTRTPFDSLSVGLPFGNAPHWVWHRRCSGQERGQPSKMDNHVRRKQSRIPLVGDDALDGVCH